MAQKQNKQTVLVDVAARLFHQRGYNRVSLGDIAAAAGMRQGNVYYYYKTKKSIAYAVLTHCNDMLLALYETLKVETPKGGLSNF